MNWLDQYREKLSRWIYAEWEEGVLLCGDCLDIMPMLPARSIDMVFTDPPYGHNNNSDDLIARREAALGLGEYIPEENDRPIANDDKEATPLYQQALKEINRLIPPGCCCCCCCCGGGGPDPQFARWSLIMDEEIGFKMMVVWDKGPMGMGWHYRRSYETVLVGMKPGAKCRWFDETRKVENVIRNIGKIIPTKDQHPTEKPVALPEHFIRLHSSPSDLVLDPFFGSGATAIAAIRSGRRFIGIEIEKEWCVLAKQRIENELSQPRLFT